MGFNKYYFSRWSASTQISLISFGMRNGKSKPCLFWGPVVTLKEIQRKMKYTGRWLQRCTNRPNLWKRCGPLSHFKEGYIWEISYESIRTRFRHMRLQTQAVVLSTSKQKTMFLWTAMQKSKTINIFKFPSFLLF